MKRRAIVLLSGGIDSAVASAMIRPHFEQLDALTIDYGQSHAVEIQAAMAIAKVMQFDSHTVVPARCFPWSPLTGTELDGPCIVPARNVVLLSIALSHAIDRDADGLVMGCNATDGRDYADCRLEFLNAFERAARLIHRVRVLTPCGALDKGTILRLGRQLGVPLALTVTCYRATAERRRCGVCQACHLLEEAEAQAHLTVA